MKSGLTKARPAFGDLRPWAVQGILLVNAALTTREGATKSHMTIWKPFMEKFLDALCAKTQSRFLLWGSSARDLVSPYAHKYKREVLFWTHPSPMGDNQQPPAKRFVHCDHFAKLNKALEAEKKSPIWWSIDSPVMAFTDGSCPLNGKPKGDKADVEAGFGVLLIGGHVGPTTLRGLASPTTYRLVDTNDPKRGLRRRASSVTPTNNRGELMGFCWVFDSPYPGRVLGSITIVSDSEHIVVRMFNEYLPKRRVKGTAYQLENYDLIVVAEAMLGVLRAQATSVTIVHTRAAHDRQCPSRTMDRKGPAKRATGTVTKADRLASSAIEDGVPVEIRTNVAPIRYLG